MNEDVYDHLSKKKGFPLPGHASAYWYDDGDDVDVVQWLPSLSRSASPWSS